MNGHQQGELSAAARAFWLLIGGPLCFLGGLRLVWRLLPPYRHLSDFTQEWTSARNFFTGHPIYWSMSESIPVHFGKPYRVLLEYNAHPPAAVLLTLPLAPLDYGAAYLVWNLLSLVALIASLWLILRPASLGYSAWAVLPFATLLLISNSLIQQVNQGQLNLVLLLLVTGAWALQRRGQWGWSGTLVGIAAALKLFPAFLGLYFLMQRRWRAVFTTVGVFVVVNLLTAGVLGWEAYRDYFSVVVPRVSGFREFWPNASITGYWSKLFEGASGHVVPLWQAPALAKLATAVSSLIVVLLTAQRCWRADTLAARDQAFGLCTIAMLLLSPITWDHYFLLLVLPLAILWQTTRPTAVNRGMLIAVVVLLGVIYPKWVWDATIPGDGELLLTPGGIRSVALPWHALSVVAYQFYALLGLFAFACLAVRPAADRGVGTAGRAQAVPALSLRDPSAA